MASSVKGGTNNSTTFLHLIIMQRQKAHSISTTTATGNSLKASQAHIHNISSLRIMKLLTTLLLLSQIVAPCLATLSITLAPEEEFCFAFRTPLGEPSHIT